MPFSSLPTRSLYALLAVSQVASTALLVTVPHVIMRGSITPVVAVVVGGGVDGCVDGSVDGGVDGWLAGSASVSITICDSILCLLFFQYDTMLYLRKTSLTWLPRREASTPSCKACWKLFEKTLPTLAPALPELGSL